MTRIGYALLSKNAGESIKSATQIRYWAKHFQYPNAANPQKDAQAQRHRGLGKDAQIRLAAVQAHMGDKHHRINISDGGGDSQLERRWFVHGGESLTHRLMKKSFWH